MAWIPGPAMGTEPFAVDGNRAYILDRQIFEHFGDIGSHSLLTILPVTSTILLGTLAGDLVRGEGTAQRRLLGLFAGGVGLCVVALFVSQWIPINRRLWTPSFALLTSGVAVLVFAALSWLLDVQRTRKGTEWLIAFGRNPIFLFVLSEVVRIIAETKGIRDSAGNWRSYWTVGYETLLSIADPKAASAIFALAYVISFGIVAVAMHRKGWIVKI
jgi:predicted acyltransferase